MRIELDNTKYLLLLIFATGSTKGLDVAVVDTGCSFHPDIAPNLWLDPKNPKCSGADANNPTSEPGCYGWGRHGCCHSVRCSPLNRSINIWILLNLPILWRYLEVLSYSCVHECSIQSSCCGINQLFNTHLISFQSSFTCLLINIRSSKVSLLKYFSELSFSLCWMIVFVK